MNKILYPKNFPDLILAHHSRVPKKMFDLDKIFTAVKNRCSLFERVDNTIDTLLKEKGTVTERDKNQIRLSLTQAEVTREMYQIPDNKPEPGTGLWVSPMIEDNLTSWYKFCIEGGVDPKSHKYHIITPDEDCKIMYVHDSESLIYFVNTYNYDFEKMKEDFDLLLVNNDYYTTSEVRIPEIDGVKLKSPWAFDSWSCSSGLFLNPKFVVSGKGKIAKELRDPCTKKNKNKASKKKQKKKEKLSKKNKKR